MEASLKLDELLLCQWRNSLRTHQCMLVALGTEAACSWSLPQPGMDGVAENMQVEHIYVSRV